MAYDIFSQPKGPDISISLFSDAAKAGAAVGKEIPGTTQAIIEGVTQGVQTGQKIYDNYQRAEIQQHAIERFPQADRAQDAAITEAEQLNSIRETQVEAAKLNRNTDILAAQQKSEATLTAAKMQNEDLANSQYISEALASGDPLLIGKIFSEPSIQGTLQRNEKLADSTYGKIFADKNLPKEMQDAAWQQQDLTRQALYQHDLDKYNQTIIAGQAKKSQDEWDKLFARGAYNDLFRGKNPSEIASDYTVIRDGSKPTNTDGNILFDSPDLPPVAGEKVTPRYSLYNKKTGQLLRNNLTPEDASTFNNAVGTTNSVSSLISQQVYGTSTPPEKPKPPAVPTPNASPIPLITGPQASPTSPIVDQKRKAFDALSKSPPPGMGEGSLEQRLKAKKDAIQKALPTPQQNAGVMGFFNNAANTVSEAIVPSAQAEEHTPTKSLSRALGTPVALTFPHEPLHKDVFNRIIDEPLLVGQPPLIRGMAAIESGGSRSAKSHTGVKGLLQVTQATARSYGLNRDIPEQNVLAGKRYMYDNLLRFDGNVRLALAAYNGGPSLISEAVRETGSTRWGDVLGYLKENLSAKKFKEVAEYPDKVLAAASQFTGDNPENDNYFAYQLDRNGLISAKNG